MNGLTHTHKGSVSEMSNDSPQLRPADDVETLRRRESGRRRCLSGRSTVKVHPLPGWLRTRISPPFARAPFMLMESPSPSPLFVKGSRRLG